MKKTVRIYLIFFVSVLLILYILNIFGAISDAVLSSAFYAVLLNFLNSLTAFLLFVYSFEKSNKVFLAANLGGMGFRLFFLLVLVFIFIKFLNIDKYGFILTFFIFYFFSLFLEIFYIKNKIEEKKGNN